MTTTYGVGELILAALAARAAWRARAAATPQGETVAVFGAGVGGLVVHELIGHALEGDAKAPLAVAIAGRGVKVVQALFEGIVDRLYGRFFVLGVTPTEGVAAQGKDGYAQFAAPQPATRKLCS